MTIRETEKINSKKTLLEKKLAQMLKAEGKMSIQKEIKTCEFQN